MPSKTRRIALALLCASILIALLSISPFAVELTRAGNALEENMVRIENVTLPIRPPDGPAVLQRMDLRLQVANQEATLRAFDLLPRLRDAIDTEIYTNPPTEDTAAAMLMVKNRLLAAARRVMGQQAVLDVLIMKTRAR